MLYWIVQSLVSKDYFRTVENHYRGTLIDRKPLTVTRLHEWIEKNPHLKRIYNLQGYGQNRPPTSSSDGGSRHGVISPSSADPIQAAPLLHFNPSSEILATFP